MSESAKKKSAKPTASDAQQKGSQLAGSTLAKTFFNVEHPEEFITSIPVQSVYLAIQSVGLESAADVLSLVSDDQYKSLLAFELWQRDSFHDGALFRWLAVIDEDSSFEPIERFVKLVDVNLLLCIIARYVRCVFFEEPTEQPPDKGWYTPDRGSTWLYLEINNADAHRLLGKLLAVVFETRPNLFYQLLSSSGAGTYAEFQEDAYKVKRARLLDEGIPDETLSAEVNSNLSIEQVAKEISSSEKIESEVPSVSVVTPLVYRAGAPEPFSSLIDSLATSPQKRIDAESEISFLANASLMFFGVTLSNYDELNLHLERLRGAINIGIELLIESSNSSVEDVYNTIGFQKIYRVGLTELRSLRAMVLQASDEALDKLQSQDPKLSALCEACISDFPSLPIWFGQSAADAEKLPTGIQAFTRLAEVEEVEQTLRTQLFH